MLFVAVACNGSPAEPRDALSAGWVTQFDAPDEKPEQRRILAHADALEVKPGPNVNLWHPELAASGNFRLSADVTHLDSGLHPHGAGLTVGGSDALGKSQRYTYFLVRCDGKFLIKTRDGDDYPEIVPWTEHRAVSPEDKKGVTKNRLTIEALAEDVRFLVNGSEVHRAKRKDLPVDGGFGFRLVHDTHVRYGKPVVERLD